MEMGGIGRSVKRLVAEKEDAWPNGEKGSKVGIPLCLLRQLSEFEFRQISKINKWATLQRSANILLPAKKNVHKVKKAERGF